MNSKFRVIVAGGRDFSDYELLKTKLDKILKNKENIVIVCGKAPGADSLGEKYAKEKGYEIDEYPALWDDFTLPGCIIKTNKNDYKFNCKAGTYRNTQMSENADALVAFWDEKSTGTADMIKKAKNKKLLIRIINY